MEITINTKLGNNGRFVIPRKIREELGLKDGDPMLLSVENGKIIISTKDVLLEDFYNLCKNIRESEVDVVDELIQERHKEAELE